jgi:VWFA-related protein
MQLLRLLLLGIVSASSILAQEPVYTLKVEVPIVSLDVAVFDAANKPVTSLDVYDFLVYEDGVPQQIRNFSPVTTPYNILLLFDRSGSTQSRWMLMQSAVAGFLSNLRPQDRAALAAFDADYELLAGWKDSRDQPIKALDALVRPRPESVGLTDLYRALERSVDREFRGVTGRHAVIVLTDGRDDSLYRQTIAGNHAPSAGEDRDFQKTLRSVQKQRAPVYFIGVNTDRNLEATNPGVDYLRLRQIFPNSSVPLQFLTEARLRMESLANGAGGRAFFPDRLEDIVPLYDQIGRELSGSYSLGYAPPSTKSGRMHRIEVKVRGGLRVWQSRTTY